MPFFMRNTRSMIDQVQAFLDAASQADIQDRDVIFGFALTLAQQNNLSVRDAFLFLFDIGIGIGMNFTAEESLSCKGKHFG